MAGRVSRRLLLWSQALLVVVALLAGVAGPARAASNDEDVELLVQSVLEGEYLQTQFVEALEKLELAQQACEGKTCSPKVRARVYVAIGTVLAGGLKRLPEAKDAFVIALREDPTVALFSDYITPDVQRAFNDARGVAKGSSGSAEIKPEAERGPKKKFSGRGRPPRGWKSAEAYFYFREATASEREREWLDCADYAQASLSAENRATTRFLAGSCEERAGLWIEALADYQIVADTAGKTGLFDTAKEARSRAQVLRDKIPKIVLRKPANAKDLVVKMNDDEVPAKKLGGEIWVNPGQRLIHARGKVDGAELEFEQLVDLGEFETVTVDIKLAPRGARADSTVMRCMAQASTREELARCINGPAKGAGAGLSFRAGLEISGYHDSDHVDVGSPALSFSVESPTSGWGASAGFLVDVVTAASTDIVSTASPRWTEYRYVPVIGGHKKFDDLDVSAHAELSIEPDYLAAGGGVGAALDLAQKTVTPSLSYDFGYDISGRSGTPFSVYGNTLTRHGIAPGVGLVLGKATFLAVSFTAVLELGDSSKPYRYIPMFSEDIAGRVPAGYAIDAVNRDRLPIRVLEQLPTDRQRWAVAGRIAHRFSSSTIRAEERLYMDSWGLKATTTDSSFLVDLTDAIRVWPHIRFHAQTSVDFWRLAYAAAISDNGDLTIPALRTGDRELGPMLSATLGGGGRFAFGPAGRWGLTVTADFIYSRYLEHLYILQKFGYFGATTFEMEFE